MFQTEYPGVKKHYLILSHQHYIHYHLSVLQCVPLTTEPSISLIILTPMKILQRNLNRSTFVVWEMKRNVSVVHLISSIVITLLKKCRVR